MVPDSAPPKITRCPFASAHDASPSQPAGAPQTTPGPADLTSLDAGADPLAFLSNLTTRYGDAVRYRTRLGPCFLFLQPAHVEHILHRENYHRASLVKMILGDGLLASEGNYWRENRRLMQPDFLPQRIARFVPIITRQTAALASDWSIAAATGQAVDVTAAMTRLTLRIVVESLFSDDLSDADSAELCDAITQIIYDLGRISWTVFGIPANFTPQSNAAFAAAKAVIDRVCCDMIAKRQALSPEKRPQDLLTLLIEAKHDAGSLNQQQLRDEMVTMLVGGHETTALALAWTWKTLAEQPAVESRLHDEAKGFAHRDPQYTDLPALAYAKAVFQEAMRLYPPVWYMAKVAQTDDNIDGHAIPRGACVLVSAYFTHRHEKFWTDALRFDPTRFLDSSNKPAHRYAYFPFGGGRHQCLGIHFATIEGTLILAQLASQFRLLPLNAEQVRPNPTITLRQAPSLVACIEFRQTASRKRPAA